MKISKKLQQTIAMSLAMVATAAPVSAMTAAPTLKTTVETSTQTNPAKGLLPEFTGVEDVVVQKYGSFSIFGGIQAWDEIDGDITSEITLSGIISTSVEGSYIIRYSVTNSRGYEHGATRMITVYDKHKGDTYDINKAYIAGDKVIYDGKEYVATWYTKSNAVPGASINWKPVEEVTYPAYEAGKRYFPGDQVVHKGVRYIAYAVTSKEPVLMMYGVEWKAVLQ